jgi:hypothetical protein
MALYTLSGRSIDGADELTGFISGKEPFGYHPKSGYPVRVIIYQGDKPRMKRIAIFIIVWLIFASPNSQAGMSYFKQISIAFTNAADAQTNATWSEPDKITVSWEGLGWDGDARESRDGWIQTKSLALGSSSRPAYIITVRAAIRPPPREFTLSNGQKLTPDAGDMYVRYSPDLKHWSSWQALQRAEPQSIEEKKIPARNYSGTIRVPNRERRDYVQLIYEYSQMDVPWKSDEEAAVKWIVNRDPDFFAKHIPFIGYAQFLYEGQFCGGQRIQFLKVEISYGMSGFHSVPRDEAASMNRDVPWRYEDKSPAAESTTSPNAAPPHR